MTSNNLKGFQRCSGCRIVDFCEGTRFWKESPPSVLATHKQAVCKAFSSPPPASSPTSSLSFLFSFSSTLPPSLLFLLLFLVLLLPLLILLLLLALSFSHLIHAGSPTLLEGADERWNQKCRRKTLEERLCSGLFIVITNGYTHTHNDISRRARAQDANKSTAHASLYCSLLTHKPLLLAINQAVKYVACVLFIHHGTLLIVCSGTCFMSSTPCVCTHSSFI